MVEMKAKEAVTITIPMNEEAQEAYLALMERATPEEIEKDSKAHLKDCLRGFIGEDVPHNISIKKLKWEVTNVKIAR